MSKNTRKYIILASVILFLIMALILRFNRLVSLGSYQTTFEDDVQMVESVSKDGITYD